MANTTDRIPEKTRLKLPKTDVWERLLSVLGTRGGRSKALTLIPAA